MTCIKMGSDDSHFNVSLTYLHTPPPPKQKQNTFSPSLISLMVSVDVKHHVYLLTKAEREKAQWTLRGTLEHRFPPRKDVVNQCLEFASAVHLLPFHTAPELWVGWRAS